MVLIVVGAGEVFKQMNMNYGTQVQEDDTATMCSPRQVERITQGGTPQKAPVRKKMIATS